MGLLLLMLLSPKLLLLVLLSAELLLLVLPLLGAPLIMTPSMMLLLLNVLMGLLLIEVFLGAAAVQPLFVDILSMDHAKLGDTRHCPIKLDKILK